MMRYIFFGTPHFAEIVLKKLIAAGMPPIAVVCNPDRPVGRKKIITPPPVKVVAQENSIKVYQPEKLSLSDWKSEIGEIDFAVVAAYAKIIKQEIIDTAKLGFIGVHPSLLPKFRGPSPIQTAILEGVPETGVTLFMLDDKVDHGPIVGKSRIVKTDSKTYLELEEELANAAGDALVDILSRFADGKINPEKQDETAATFTKKIETEDAFIDESDLDDAKNGNNSQKADEVFRKILALNPEPGTYTMRNGVRIKLLAARVFDSKLKLDTIQEAGKTPRSLE